MGIDMAYYEDSIIRAVEQRNISFGGNLMLYFDEEQNSGVKKKAESTVPSVEIRNRELIGCTTVKLKESLTDKEMADLKEYLKGQFSDGWGEGFEQQEIQTGDGVLFVHFWDAEDFSFEIEQTESAEPGKEQTDVPKRPKMKLVGMEGNIFFILGKADQLLRKNGQEDQAKEMISRAQKSGNYYKALNIISEYVETELSERAPVNPKKERGDGR